MKILIILSELFIRYKTIFYLLHITLKKIKRCFSLKYVTFSNANDVDEQNILVVLFFLQHYL